MIAELVFYVLTALAFGPYGLRSIFCSPKGAELVFARYGLQVSNQPHRRKHAHDRTYYVDECKEILVENNGAKGVH